MVTRLTALLLSFCIGLPMCWCCPGEAPREEMAGCCSTGHLEGCAAQQPESSPDSREPCPCCEHPQGPRQAASTLLFTPKPEAAPVLHLAGWQDGLPALDFRLSLAAEAPRHERGPLEEPPQLFLHHRALLL